MRQFLTALVLTTLFALSGLATLTTTRLQAQEAPAAADGAIERVTLYRGEALVTRLVPVGRGTGPLEVVVGNLPKHVIGESLFADGSESVQVRAVRYRERYLGGEATKQPELVERLEELELLIRQNNELMALNSAQLAFLANLESFSHRAASDDLNRGQLNAESLIQISTFVLEKRGSLHAIGSQLRQQDLEYERQLTRLRKEFEASGQSRPTLIREAVIFLDKKVADTSSVFLNYLVSNVSWTPTYTIRATSGGDKVSLEYNALVQQISGEDWTNAALTLSTATPAMISQGGSIEPFTIALTGSFPATTRSQVQTEADFSRNSEELKDRANAAARNMSNIQRRDSQHYTEAGNSQAALTRALNDIAQELQNLELNAPAEIVGRAAPSTAGISVEYRIEGRTSLMNRGERQLVSVLRKDLKAEMAYVATPVLSDYIFLEANLRNDGNDVLLSGESTSYLDGRFVGRSTLPMVARGQRFTAGFGIDDQLRVARELTEKKADVRGGNLVTTYTYRITLQNFKDRAVVVRLMDRMPTPQLNSDIKVRLLEEGSALSKDADYLATERPKGVLRWDLEVKPNAFNATAHVLTYKFEMEHDKSLRVIGN